MIYDCWHTGGEQEGSENHTKMAQAPIVNAFVTQQSTCLPTPTATVNNDIYLDWYENGVTSSYAFSSLSELLPFELPVSCASITTSFNMILNSGCTNHIICDQALFWTYREDEAVPVKTANCGILNMLAHGDVKFLVPFGQQQIILTLQDCLLAPDAPLNLLSVGVMQEKCMQTHFNEKHTIIHFPSDNLVLS